VVGLGAFVLSLIVAAILFSRSIASLRRRTANIVQLMFFMPQSVAVALKKRASARLARTINALDEVE